MKYYEPEDAPRTHVPEMEQLAYNQMPKHGEHEKRLFRYNGTNLYQWFAKPPNSAFEEAMDQPFMIVPTDSEETKLHWKHNRGAILGPHQTLMVGDKFVGHFYDDASDGVDIDRILTHMVKAPLS